MRGLVRQNWGGFALVAVLSAGVAMVAIAQDAGIEKRTGAMKSVGAAMKTLSGTAKGEMPFSPDTVKAAQAVVDHSKTVPGLFKGGAPGKGSAAKSEIWSDWAGFEKASKDYEAAAPQLVPAAQSNEAPKLGAALQAVGGTCGGCHKPYRAEKKTE
jgi:cytochrome c556